MFLPGYLKSRVEQFYSDLLGLLITGDNNRTSRWEILHRKITRPWKGKLLGLGGSPSFRPLLAPRISRGHFFLANFFRVTHDGLSERGTTRSLCFGYKSVRDQTNTGGKKPHSLQNNEPYNKSYKNRWLVCPWLSWPLRLSALSFRSYLRRRTQTFVEAFLKLKLAS